MTKINCLIVKWKNVTFFFNSQLFGSLLYTDINYYKILPSVKCICRPYVSLLDLNKYFEERQFANICYTFDKNKDELELSIITSMRGLYDEREEAEYNIQRVDAQDFTEKQLINKINMFLFRDRIDLYAKIMCLLGK